MFVSDARTLRGHDGDVRDDAHPLHGHDDALRGDDRTPGRQPPQGVPPPLI